MYYRKKFGNFLSRNFRKVGAKWWRRRHTRRARVANTVGKSQNGLTVSPGRKKKKKKTGKKREENKKKNALDVSCVPDERSLVPGTETFTGGRYYRYFYDCVVRVLCSVMIKKCTTRVRRVKKKNEK